MDDGRKTQREMGCPFLWMQKFMLCFNHSGRIHLIFKRAHRSNAVRTVFNLSSLQVALTTWSCLVQDYDQLLIFNLEFL